VAAGSLGETGQPAPGASVLDWRGQPAATPGTGAGGALGLPTWVLAAGAGGAIILWFLLRKRKVRHES
jgi:hypothetical protein